MVVKVVVQVVVVVVVKVALPDETDLRRACVHSPLHRVPKFVEALFGKGRKFHVL